MGQVEQSSQKYSPILSDVPIKMEGWLKVPRYMYKSIYKTDEIIVKQWISHGITKIKDIGGVIVVDHGLSPVQVNQKTIKLVFAASLLSTCSIKE